LTVPTPRIANVGCWLLALAVIAGLCWRDVAGLMVDLDVYRAGALTLVHGGSLYAMRAIDRLPFTYPPVAAMLAIPLALVPFGVAKIAWIPLVYGPLAVAVWFSFRPLISRAGAYGPAVFAAVVGASALLLPVRQEIRLGQIDLILLALCLLDCAAARPRWPRGLLVGIATAIKLVPGVFIVYLLITGRRRAAGIAALTFAGLTMLAFLAAPADSVTYWTSAVFDTSRLGGNASAENQSLRGMILRAFLPAPAPAALWLVAAIVVAVLGFAAARACWRRGDNMAGIAITGLLAVALSPVAWIHHACWVVVAAGVITGAGLSMRRNVTAAVTAGLFLTMLPQWAQAALTRRRWPELPGRLIEDSFGLAVLALIAILYLLTSTGANPAGEDPAGDDLPARTSVLGEPVPSAPLPD
jgi:alpha-1,2-mannosyltransferase